MNRRFHPPYKPRLASRKDYDHAKTFGAAPLMMPKELLNITPILNQGNRPSCTAYASAAMRRAMTGTEYDPELQWELELQYKGVTDATGFPMEVPAEVGKKIGFIPKGKSFPQDKVGGYFWVTKLQGMDWFDTLRSTQNQLFQRTGKVIPLQFGINWYGEWDNTPHGIIPDSKAQLLGGHDTLAAGFETYSIDGQDYIVNQGSWGTEFGDEGIFRFNRAQTNKNIGKFGIFYWLDEVDIPNNIARLKIYAAILQNIKAIYQLIVNSIHANGTWPPPTPTPPTTPPVTPKYLWDTPANARHSVRVICDEEGLSLNDKNIMCACVEVESNFNPKALHGNKDKIGIVWSTDYGIAQVNDWYHIGPGKDFPSVDYVLNNPEACIRWMARLWKAGRQKLWASYTSGAYKQYL